MKGSKESVAGLKPDGIDKEDQPDYVDMLRQAQPRIQRPYKEADEEHGSNSELEAEDIDVADQVAKSDYGKKQQKRIVCQQI